MVMSDSNTKSPCECHPGPAHIKQSWGALEAADYLEVSLNNFASRYYDACYFKRLSSDDKQLILRQYKRVLTQWLKNEVAVSNRRNPIAK